MKPVSELWQDDPDLAMELLEERAAIIAEGEGCTQWLAENTAAKQAGFQDWRDAKSKIRPKNQKSADQEPIKKMSRLEAWRAKKEIAGNGV